MRCNFNVARVYTSKRNHDSDVIDEEADAL